MAEQKYRHWLEPDQLMLLAAWTRDGATYAAIAEKIGVSRATLYEWAQKYPEIRDALTRTREIVDTEIENSLYRRATGYDYEEEEQRVDGKGQVITLHHLKHMPGDVSAQKFWLMNRSNGKWRERRDEIRTDEDTGTGVVILPARTEGAEDGGAD